MPGEIVHRHKGDSARDEIAPQKFLTIRKPAFDELHVSMRSRTNTTGLDGLIATVHGPLRSEMKRPMRHPAPPRGRVCGTERQV